MDNSRGLELLLGKMINCSLRWLIMFPTMSPFIGKINNCGQHFMSRIKEKIDVNVAVIPSILWCRHGIRQLRSGWADGPAYITQCPIQTGQSYTYNFTITGQRGTLFWHAHISWLRSTLYGPLIILPRRNESYPFKKPYKEIPIIFGN